jgi:hypothetical protein
VALLLFRNKKRFRRNNFKSNQVQSRPNELPCNFTKYIFLFHPRSIFFSISLSVFHWQFPYFHTNEWKFTICLLGKKCFCSRGGSNPQPTKELTHRTGALAITTVGSLNKNCGSKVLYKGSIGLKMVAPASEVTGSEDIPYHFKIGRPCPF